MITAEKHLTPIGSGDRLRTCVKNIRADLKLHFPGVKFSVSLKRTNTSESVLVAWMDGPTLKAVNQVIARYEAGRFDGMQDLYEYNTTGFHRQYGSTQFLFTNRQYSDFILQGMIRQVCTYFDAPSTTLESWKQGWPISSPNCSDVRREIWRRLQETDLRVEVGR